ncbi:glycosyltransferase family 2 protein [Halochromatium glycolicum]|uniref:Glycosyltransferase 2-like domain-containing protein n=1 Tax=Halochromatium glycolicum TaxID=85075 RepID=A0AAJ0U8A4_9GAMM|nr:glycosyltransferase family 2 protein [Halochromatium glycolicum]MBK1707168.1 hypothetical protein [Halochromatium glycolicum]
MSLPSRLLDYYLERLGQGLASQVRPAVGLWDPERQQPTPTDHYGQLACALALALLGFAEQAQAAEQAWLAVSPTQRGHAPFNRFLLLLLNRCDGRQRMVSLCPLQRAYPSNNWTLLAQLCRLLEAREPAQHQRADRRLRQLLTRWVTDSGGFIDAPARPARPAGASTGCGRVATPMAYHHKALFVASVAAWQTGDQRWAPILTKLLDWTLLSWDGDGCVGGFGRSNHALFGEACLLAALLLIGAAQPEQRERLPGRMFAGVLRRWRHQVRADGLLWLTPADAATPTQPQPKTRGGWDEYMHLSVYNAWTAAILAWACQLTTDAERPAVLDALSLPSVSHGLRTDPSAGLLRVESQTGGCALVSTRGQPPQAFRRTEIEGRYSGGLPFHLRARDRYLLPPPVRLPVEVLLQRPALAGWLPVFEVGEALYGLTNFETVVVQWSQAVLSLMAEGCPLALTRPPARGLSGRLLAALDWRVLGGRLGRRQALRRTALTGVSAQLHLRLDLDHMTLSQRLTLDNAEASRVRYLNPAGHALMAAALPEQHRITGADQVAVDASAMTSDPLPTTLPGGQGYCQPSAILPPGRSSYGIELGWSRYRSTDCMHVQAKQIAVLIPYFQREPGILRNTVGSVLAQQGFEDYQIIVVDDGAPAPARDELKELGGGEERISLIEQANAGPGAARNTALANLPADTPYVAFLDSDDALHPSYLADAVHALDQGYDLFFGNSQRADIAGTRFDWNAGPGAMLEPAAHTLIDPERQLYAFQGDFFDFIVYRSNIIGPSTMMYRQAIAPGIRYNEQVYNGQDRIFKLKLCRQVGPVAFSTKCYAQEGRGINIFDSAGWGSQRSLSFASSYIEMCKVVLKEIPLNPRQRAHVKGHLAQTRYNFTAGLLHQARQRAGIDWKVVAKTLRDDPGTSIGFIPNAAKILLRKVHSA